MSSGAKETPPQALAVAGSTSFILDPALHEAPVQ